MTPSLPKIQQQIAALEKEREVLIRKEKASVIEDIMTKIAQFRITPQELGLAGNGHSKTHAQRTFKKTGAKVPIKYQLGDRTWSGRGRRPHWFAEHVAKGKKVEDLLVKSH